MSELSSLNRLIDVVEDARARMRDVPNKPKTPIRTVRVSDAEWAEAQAKADEEGTTISEYIRQALRDWKPNER